MQRSKLEIASWIAGIFSAVFAIYVYATSQLSAQQEQKSLAAALQTTPTHFQNTDGAEFPKESKSQLSEVIVVERAKSQLSEAIAAAKAISSWQARDEALEKIAYVAIKQKEFEIAVDVAGAMTSLQLRDKVLGHASCYALSYRNIKIAQVAAGRIYDWRRRDDTLRMIASELTIKQGEGSNDGSCQTL